MTLLFMTFNIHLFKCLWLRVCQTLKTANTCNHPGNFAKRNFCKPNFSFNLSVPIQRNRHTEQESCENCIYKLTYINRSTIQYCVILKSFNVIRYITVGHCAEIQSSYVGAAVLFIKCLGVLQDLLNYQTLNKTWETCAWITKTNFHWEGLQEDCSHMTALLHIHNVHCRFSLHLELELIC